MKLFILHIYVHTEKINSFSRLGQCFEFLLLCTPVEIRDNIACSSPITHLGAFGCSLL